MKCIITPEAPERAGRDVALASFNPCTLGLRLFKVAAGDARPFWQRPAVMKAANGNSGAVALLGRDFPTVPQCFPSKPLASSPWALLFLNADSPLLLSLSVTS